MFHKYHIERFENHQGFVELRHDLQDNQITGHWECWPCNGKQYENTAPIVDFSHKIPTVNYKRLQLIAKRAWGVEASEEEAFVHQMAQALEDMIARHKIDVARRAS